jgi:hypothetical protein
MSQQTDLGSDHSTINQDDAVNPDIIPVAEHSEQRDDLAVNIGESQLVESSHDIILANNSEGAEFEADIESKSLNAPKDVLDDDESKKYIKTNPVQRIVLAYGVQNREPVNIVPHKIDAKEASFSLFMFTELADYTGQYIIHRWLRKGQVMSEVKLPVNASSWRTWSSKRIMWHWQGSWTVEIVNDQNEVIETYIFRYGI